MSTDGMSANVSTAKLKKGDRSQRAIKAAARKVFEADGFTKARVQDIAAEAGFSNGAFYRYFSDKTSVMMALLKDLVEGTLAFAREPLGSGHPTNSIYLTTRSYLEFYAENRDLFALLVEASHTHPDVETMWNELRTEAVEHVTHMLDTARDSGHMRAEVDPQTAAELLTAMTDQYAYLRFVLDRMPEQSVEAVSRQVTEIWSGGVFMSPAAPRIAAAQQTVT